nr:hypothetical protein FFPRI1PSEUD_23750 [Pseudomonas sp. FFPRI_1]
MKAPLLTQLKRYVPTSLTITPDDWIVSYALQILEQRTFQRGPELTSPQEVSQFLRLKLMKELREVFMVTFLDSKHRVIACEALFHGTIDSSTVHPRIVFQKAMEHNAAAVILCHNHPSGDTEASNADKIITARLKSVLSEIDVRLLDHFIVGQGQPFSFAEAGLI